MLYGKWCSTVIQLKRTPAGYEGANYEDRGWCFFEQVVASICKQSEYLLDLSLVQSKSAYKSNFVIPLEDEADKRYRAIKKRPWGG